MLLVKNNILLNKQFVLFLYEQKTIFAFLTTINTCGQMRNLKRYFLYFFVLIVSSSILFDWSDFAHSITSKKTGITVLEKYEEISTANRNFNFQLKAVFSFNICSNSIKTVPQLPTTYNFWHFFKIDFFYDCKIKSHLHLLQLF